VSYGFMTLLPDRGLIELRGPDTGKFLQGLVTNTIEKAHPGEAIFAGLLTPKGKIISDFLIFLRDAETYWIDCPKAHTADLIKRLTLFKLRAKLDISDRSDDFAIGAAWGDEPFDSSGACVAAFIDPRYAPLGARVIFERGAERVTAPAAETLGDTAYHAHRIALAIPQGGLDYVYGEAFPHEACYDDLHGVDFHKGCYVGQEVVSRMHHKGTPKTRIAGIEASAPLEGGGAEILADGKPVGRLGSVDETQGVALIRLDRVEAALEAGAPLQVGHVAVTVRQPPWASYVVPAQGPPR